MRDLDQEFRENEEQSPLVEAVNKLPTDERYILLVWLYCGTLAATARHFRVSESLMRRKMQIIKDKIKDVHRPFDDCDDVGGDN